MYVDFDSLHDHARIWVYQADRRFKVGEEKLIRKLTQAFCDHWNAHGEPLKTSFKIQQNQFLILAVDEDYRGPSGCSIDGSVRMLKSLKEHIGVDFLDYSRVAVLMDNEVSLIPFTELRQAVSSGKLSAASLTFNVQAPSKGALDKDWIVAAGKTWLARYLPKDTVA
jgi:hypothetical protein